jgi:hypothetical protein
MRVFDYKLTPSNYQNYCVVDFLLTVAKDLIKRLRILLFAQNE